ncbi:MAG: succinate dehydrogenase, hydrophobic membrane anchor protein, partial [Candidatus Competibacteraceae bacterium]|nr:succinate dehydrogenase, hydrophobic membrane anchor protein [Candidatus Competibacteraceae bacterium]
MSIRTPLAHARGLGTAKDGTHHWWLQRVTSVALVPLVLWFAFSLLSVSRADYEGFQHWLSNPINAGLMIALVLAAFYHANLGMQVIYE